MSKKNEVTHVFAIVRWDKYLPVEVPKQITVKSIVWTQNDAESEVHRLNMLDPSGQSLYFWQMTRLTHG